MPVDLANLESHLAQRSYIEGYTPSQADVHVFQALSQDLGYPNVARWYKHIKSYESEFGSLSGSSSAGQIFTGDTSAAAGGDDGDDEVDLFGSDEEEDAEAERIKAERVAAYNEKKAKANKPEEVGKTLVILDVSPWNGVDEDEEEEEEEEETDTKVLEEEAGPEPTDMEALEKAVRSIERNGLVWGTGKMVPLAFGIQILKIAVVIENELVSVQYDVIPAIMGLKTSKGVPFVGGVEFVMQKV